MPAQSVCGQPPMTAASAMALRSACTSDYVRPAGARLRCLIHRGVSGADASDPDIRSHRRITARRSAAMSAGGRSSRRRGPAANDRVAPAPKDGR